MNEMKNRSEKTDNKSDELFIKANIKNPILKEFLNRLEEKYGCLLTNSGTLVDVGGDYTWLSVKSVAIIASELDKDISNNIFAGGVTCNDCSHYEPCFSGGRPLWADQIQTAEEHCRHFSPRNIKFNNM